ncbi:sugar ABC transporter substrate-binding protein [Armatimonas rosea]|uniref:Ribose transport system substrate-binding protein n=1 Tax=Armatimonas rosea TaxID=685828 RepID=A0A7W9SKU0_ARMRO|nr:sugar ABC transporter substrate-binding protein [Armatimonas rosea]MBB6048462.1 ribose transport system substrate-binding protein [Armatimonas rosea]
MKRSTFVAAALLLAAGCNQPPQPTTSPTTGTLSDAAVAKAGANRPQIALVMKSLANEFFKTMEEGAKKHEQVNEDKYKLISNGIKDEQDIAKQQQLIEQMIGQKVAAIVVAPADSKALVPVCQKAAAAGIVVVNIDNRFDADVMKEKQLTAPFVGPDNRKGAKLAGDFLATKLKPGDKVAIIEGAPTAFNAQQRKAGFEDAMKQAGLVVADSQSANWETDQANKIAAAMLTAHPDIKALLCANDSMALGAVAAVKAAGKTGQVLVVGFDNIGAVQELIKSGAVLCTVDQHGDQLAAFGIDYALEMLQKKATPTDKETPVDLITAETLKK